MKGTSGQHGLSLGAGRTRSLCPGERRNSECRCLDQLGASEEEEEEKGSGERRGEAEEEEGESG